MLFETEIGDGDAAAVVSAFNELHGFIQRYIPLTR